MFRLYFMRCMLLAAVSPAREIKIVSVPSLLRFVVLTFFYDAKTIKPRRTLHDGDESRTFTGNSKCFVALFVSKQPHRQQSSAQNVTSIDPRIEVRESYTSFVCFERSDHHHVLSKTRRDRKRRLYNISDR